MWSLIKIGGSFSFPIKFHISAPTPKRCNSASEGSPGVAAPPQSGSCRLLPFPVNSITGAEVKPQLTQEPELGERPQALGSSKLSIPGWRQAWVGAGLGDPDNPFQLQLSGIY